MADRRCEVALAMPSYFRAAKEILVRAQESICDALFPIFCISCEAYGEVLCSSCRDTIPKRLSILSGHGNSIFLSAQEYRHPLVEQLIHLLKYKGYYACASVLARDVYWIWQQRLSVHTEYVVTSVPLHYSKEWQRGFNQSELLAKTFATLVSLPYENLLVRIRATRSQTTLSKEKRGENVRDAFAALLTTSVYERNIILIDDVFTTSSTLTEAARALMHAGAKQVYGLAAAHG